MVWNSIPASFTMRFKFITTLEEIQSRDTLLIICILISVISALMYFVMRFLRKIDPKVSEATPKSSFNKIGVLITLFLVVINYMILLSAKNSWTVSTNAAVILFGFLVMFLGNYMNNIRPNYAAGFRVAWTLNDPDNWRRTHQLAGRLWFAGGFVLIVAGFLLPAVILVSLMIMLLLIILIIPGVYSYRLHRNKLLNQKRV